MEKLLLAKLVICCFLLIGFLPNWANGQSINYRQYTAADGLQNDCVTAITQDSAGFLWIGTSTGLERFDGYTFTPLQTLVSDGFPETTILSLFTDQRGIIWVGTAAGDIWKLRPELGRIEPVELAHKGNVECFFTDASGKTWAAVNQHGFVMLPSDELESEQWHYPIVDEAIQRKSNFFPLLFTAPVVDHTQPNTVWIATKNGLFRFNPATLESKRLDMLTEETTDSIIHFRQLIQDEAGMLWAITFGEGLYRIDPSNESFEVFRSSSKIAARMFNSLNAYGLFPWKKDSLLIRASSGSWYVFDKLGKTFTNLSDYPEINQLPGGVFIKPYQDRAGRWWFTTHAKGGGFFGVQTQDQLFEKTLLGFDLLKIIPGVTDDKLYGITRDGTLVVYDPVSGTKKTYSVKPRDFIEGHGFQDIHFDPTGQLWILGTRDIYYWDAKQQKIFPLGWPSWNKKRSEFGYYWDMASDTVGRLYISAQHGGLGVLNTATKGVDIFDYDPDDPGSLLYAYSFGNLTLDKQGHLWGCGKGVFCFDPEKERFVNFPSSKEMDEAQQTLRVYPEFLPLEDGRVLAAHAPGQLVYIDPNKSPDQVFDWLVKQPKLAQEKIRNIVADDAGNLWFISSKRLGRYDAKTKKLDFFGQGYGLSNLNSLQRWGKDRLLIATSGGYISFATSLAKKGTVEPRPYLRSLEVLGQAYRGDSAISYQRQIDLPHDQNFFELTYGLLDLSGTVDPVFSHELYGFEPQEVADDGDQRASYTNVSDGNYSMRIILEDAFDRSKKWNAQTGLRIVPPFYRRWWFLLLMSVAAGALLYGVYAYRVGLVKREARLRMAFNQQLAEVEMKALRAQMNPHFLFNSMNTIKYFLLKNEQQMAVTYLTDFSSLIRQVLQHSEQQYISLEQEISALRLYVKLEKMRSNELFDYAFTIDDSVSLLKIMIPPLLLQPYVENAIWHGLMPLEDRKGKLEVSVEKQTAGEILICIIDNGIGRAAASNRRSLPGKKSMGMDITRQRIKLSEATGPSRFSVDIHDLVNESGTATGTKVCIVISNRT